jgi:hypothetical protein
MAVVRPVRTFVYHEVSPKICTTLIGSDFKLSNDGISIVARIAYKLTTKNFNR